MQTTGTKDFSTEIDNLEKLINNIQANVFFTLGTLIAVIALSIALGGWALKILTKHWVEEKVKKELDIIDERIIQQIKKNYQLKWRSGYVQGQNDISLSDHGLDVAEAISKNPTEFYIRNIKGFSKDNFVSLELIDADGIILDKNVRFVDEVNIKVTVEKPLESYTRWVLLWVKE